jgi:hypothetical protein
MPRYHFNIHDGVSSLDEDGTELPDIDAARRQAAQLMGQLLRDDPDMFWNGEEWRLDVTDDRGLVLFSLLFATVDAAAKRPAISAP